MRNSLFQNNFLLTCSTFLGLLEQIFRQARRAGFRTGSHRGKEGDAWATRPESYPPPANAIAKEEKPRTARAGRGNSIRCQQDYQNYLAETEGFEPSMQVLPPCSLSRGVPSTSRPRLRTFNEARMIAIPRPLVKPYWSRPKVRCRTRTASSRYFSSRTTEILISEVEIIWLLIPSSASAVNICEATPGCERMPTPTADTLQILLSPVTSRAPSLALTSSRMPIALAYSPRFTVKEKSVVPSWPTFWMIMSTSMLASAMAPRIW